ncbi:MAG: FmdE family protein [Firmicutes bacterium]|nr:FmdE family protein [Bacillota bacterium]
MSESLEAIAELIEGLGYFHGHRCPASLQGLRGGYFAMDLLNVSRAKDHELQAVVETGDNHFAGCFADGIQYSTGTTFGKGNISKNFLGRFAFTLIDPSTRKAVRVALRGERLLEFTESDFFKKRQRGVSPDNIPQSDIDFVISSVVNATDEELFTYRLINEYPIQKLPSSFEAVICSGCKEGVVASYVKVIEGKNYCNICANKILLG